MEKINILIVEDDSFLSDMYLVKFNQQGFNTEVAINGEEGLKKAKELKPDVILLDVVLPKMDGFEVLKTIKNDPSLQKTIVILLTNLGQQGDMEKGLSMGADEYIIKAHYTPSAVVTKVKEVLKKHKK